jgi:hypothetical protein
MNRETTCALLADGVIMLHLPRYKTLVDFHGPTEYPSSRRFGRQPPGGYRWTRMTNYKQTKYLVTHHD